MSQRDEWAEHERAKRSLHRSHVTPEAVAEALSGFPLPLHVSVEWVAEAIRRAVPGPNPDPLDWDGCAAFAKGIPNRTTARNAWGELSDALAEVFKVILENEEELEFNTSEHEQARLWAARAAMGDLMDVAAHRKSMEPEPAKFRSTVAKQRRVEQGFALSVIFKRAFQTDPAPQNGDFNAIGHWPDFYRRMMALAFDMRRTQQDAHVLDEIAAMTRKIRDSLGPDAEEIFVPGLPAE